MGGGGGEERLSKNKKIIHYADEYIKNEMVLRPWCDVFSTGCLGNASDSEGWSSCLSQQPRVLVLWKVVKPQNISLI